MEEHDADMDMIATEAVESYKQLMSLGMNISDMAAGHIFTNAASMLKVALDAKDSKVNRKLKQVDMMLKKARLDKMESKNAAPATEIDTDGEVTEARVFNRNDLLELMKEQPNDPEE